MGEFANLSDHDVCQPIHERLKERRLDLNMRQEQLATAANVGINTVVRLEQGKDIKFSNFISIMRALGKLNELETLFQQTVSPLAQIRQATSRSRVKQRASRQTLKPPASVSAPDPAVEELPQMSIKRDKNTLEAQRQSVLAKLNAFKDRK